MAKMFKNPALTSVEEIAKEILVRKNLTLELTKSIHAVQEESLEKSVVTDDEFTSGLCSVLEAIFIHGLKDKLIRKMSAVFGSNRDKTPEPQFWTAVCKFSHNNVIKEISSFDQVTSDVGRGRAWMRAALNDGLIASYVSNMLSDKSGLQKHYNSAAYLRDEEQSDIMKSLLEGLSEVKFELSCNNSSLNVWHGIPLQLADVWTPQAPPPPVMLAIEVTDNYTDPKNQTKSSPKTKKTSVVESLPQSSNENLPDPKIEAQPSSDDQTLKQLAQHEDTTVPVNAESEENTEDNSPVLSSSAPDQSNANYVISGLENIEKSPEQNSEEISSKVSSSDSVPDFGIEIIDDISDQAGSVGNKLSEHSGWSSSFDCDKDSGNGEANQSYDSLLQSYNKNLSKVVIGTPDLADTFSSVMQSRDDDSNYSPDAKSPDFDFEIVPKYLAAEHADEETKKLMEMVGKLCPEKGLNAQDFKCNSCGCPIGVIYGKSRLCCYDGYNYCYECHQNDLEFIPARVVHNWDFKQYPISKRAKVFISQIEKDPLLDIKVLNPAVYTAVEEMAQMQLLRTQLTYLYGYIYTCKVTIVEELRKRVWPREYLYEHVHLYSVSDLLEIPSGALSQFLLKVIAFAKKHVLSCQLCVGKGFICEKCDNDKPIFPFDVETTYRCDKCLAVYHDNCMNANMSCPKCERIRKRQQLLESAMD